MAHMCPRVETCALCPWVVHVYILLRGSVCERRRALVRNVTGHESAHVQMGSAYDTSLRLCICVRMRALVQDVHRREHAPKGASKASARAGLGARAWVRGS